ncbi:ribose ABC transporter permease [Tetragenococcus koreensis]|uniref:ABC transporter permease n=1 Tax=Tetragenococcus koreensis TaxID=290335 RepID=UPI000F516455|nr:ribose ABC transporter permease [Tetragenococcus koreensis]MDN6730735.1 ribose ABC transporter permease [Atopostipes suicloacalis]AYW46526.1 ribose ABC transporter permease [Tetragenococcus koreensis]MCF1585350.1 ribose ABC transporter permease [Tetragenococcus koreensis]MCF1619746.1 ribose ABC transporter permease [Tetragenococcus koreensis]MCF1629597.1 ribose ABC transporter permease [Tetragenococcus koreensis]
MKDTAENKTKKELKRSEFYRKLGPLLALIVLIILVTVMNPSFITPTNLLNLLRQASVNALIAFGMTFVIITGGIDLSVGSILALSGALTAGLIAEGLPPIVGIIGGLFFGGIMGLFNGFLVTKGRVAPFIATLATMTIYRGLTLIYTGGNPITGFGGGYLFQFVGRGYLFGIPFPVIIMFLAFALLYCLLHKMTFGRKTLSVGGNEDASFIAGIKTDRIKMAVYSISGVLSAVAGLILASRLNSAQPTAGTTYELDAIAAVVIGGTSLSGGKGRLFGTFVGALIMGTLNNGLNLLGVSSFYQQVVQGIVIIIAVLIDRKGN